MNKSFYNFIETKFIVAGSIKNNETKTKSLKKEFDIMFISQFREKVQDYCGTNNNIGNMRTIDTFSSFICKILNNLSKKHNKKIAVALTSSTPSIGSSIVANTLKLTLVDITSKTKSIDGILLIYIITTYECLKNR